MHSPLFPALSLPHDHTCIFSFIILGTLICRRTINIVTSSDGNYARLSLLPALLVVKIIWTKIRWMYHTCPNVPSQMLVQPAEHFFFDYIANTNRIIINIVTSSDGNYAWLWLLPALLVIKNWNQNLKSVHFLATEFDQTKNWTISKSLIYKSFIKFNFWNFLPLTIFRFELF